MGRWEEFRDTLQKRIDESKMRETDSEKLVGKFFKFKENIGDKHFTYLRVIRVDGGKIIGDQFDFYTTGYDIPDLVKASRFFHHMLEDYHNMTEILPDEFYYEVNMILSKIGLQLKDELTK